MDIFYFEAFEEEKKELEKFTPENISAGYSWKTIQEYGAEEPPADIISVRTQSDIPLSWAGKITGIITRSTGFNHILEYRKASGVEVPAGYLPLYCNRSVAEQALTLWMSLLRKLPGQISQFKDFNRDNITGRETRAKTLLVAGVGNIGYEVVKIGRGLEMNVLCVDIDKKHADVNYIDISEGIGRADIIVCCMNLTEDNVDYFNYDLLKKSKRGAVFVNVARGELSMPGGLLRLLEEGHLGGVGIDVYYKEGEMATALRSGEKPDTSEVAETLKLMEFDNVIMTPHNAFNTEEAVLNKSEQTVAQLVDFLKNGSFMWAVKG